LLFILLSTINKENIDDDGEGELLKLDKKELF
jgi:hypothetical protein